MARALHALRLGLSLLQRRRRALRTADLSERRRCVLIVVEDRLAGRHLARLLTAKGYKRVRVVRRAASALLLAERCSPAIVFLDVALLDDAYGLATTLRQHAGRRTLRLIALTNSIEHSTREQARDAGFERWLVTPVATDELDSLVRMEDAAQN
jgi:DNA-binding response OmpR family regulator